jgi:hypothetical protein
MRILRSLAVFTLAGGLALGVAWGAFPQQNTGQASGGGIHGSLQGGMQGQSQSNQPQAGQLPPIQPSSPSVPGLSTPDDGTANARTAEAMEKMRSQERQKKLVSDTDKLLSLATELKADMDKTNKDTLSLDVVRKADEIEKLAHSVKERMKGQ